MKSTRPTVQRSSLMERRRVETQRAIADAALELFLERGFDRVTVDEIAEAAGVSPRTFYRYNPTKDDVLSSVLREGLRGVTENLQARPATESLRIAVVRAIDMDEQDADFRANVNRMVTLLMSEPALRSRWLNALRTLEEDLAAIISRRSPDCAESAALVAAGTIVLGFRLSLELTARGTRTTLAEVLGDLADGGGLAHPSAD